MKYKIYNIVQHYICMFNQRFGKVQHICANHDLICSSELCHYSFGAFGVIWLLLPRCDPSCSSHITLASLITTRTKKTKILLCSANIQRDERSEPSSCEIIENVADGLIDSNAAWRSVVRPTPITARSSAGCRGRGRLQRRPRVHIQGCVS